jgi:hypothetical protein
MVPLSARLAGDFIETSMENDHLSVGIFDDDGMLQFNAEFENIVLSAGGWLRPDRQVHCPARSRLP